MFRQHTAGERFNFAEGDGLETARAFKAKGEPADAAEQVKEAKLAHLAAHPTASRMMIQSAIEAAVMKQTERKGCQRAFMRLPLPA